MFINNYDNTKHFGVFLPTCVHNYMTHRNVLTHETLPPYFFPCCLLAGLIQIHVYMIYAEHAVEYQATPVSLLYRQQTSGWGWGMVVGTQYLDFSASLDICCRTRCVLQCNWPLLFRVRFQPSFIPAPSLLTHLPPLPPSTLTPLPPLPPCLNGDRIS